MIKSVYFAFVCCLIAMNSSGQYNDPNIPKPPSGYGSDGAHTVGVVSFANPYYPSENIQIYYPSDIATKVPTLFYSHGYGGYNSIHQSGLLNFVAMKGYAIVFVPYQTIGVTVANRYDNLLDGFRKAARDYPAIIDTTKVGFVGHSFGGGATFANAYKCFTQNDWGASGRFIYSTAPWYSYNIFQAQLQAFPLDTKLLVEVFDEDSTNDHRMAIDMFSNINIPASEKDFILVKTDTIAGYIYRAGHNVPNTSLELDALDYYAIYRLLDALCDYTFNGSLTGKDVALGDGSAAQVTMPSGLQNLVQTDNPQVVYPESQYLFPCSETENVRNSYCPTILEINDIALSETNIRIFPNPTSDQVTIENLSPDSSGELKIFNSTGQLVFARGMLNQTFLTIDLTSFSNGIYFVNIGKFKTKLVVE